MEDVGYVMLSNAYTAATKAFEEAGFVHGDPAKEGHGNAHGKFEILMPAQATVKRFASNLLRKSTLSKSSNDLNARTANAAALGGDAAEPPMVKKQASLP